MFTAQLATFLIAHHHSIWATKITVSSHTFGIACHWALLKGFNLPPVNPTRV